MKNQRILQEFERRLEGAVEGFFARAFRSGLQPVELARGVRRYAEQQRQVAADAVVVPNAYRFRVNPKDADRLAGFGPRLVRELAGVVEETARDEAWALAGTVTIEVLPDPAVAYGMFRLTGRVDSSAVQGEPEAPASAEPAPKTPAPSVPAPEPAADEAAAQEEEDTGEAPDAEGEAEESAVDMTGAFTAVGAKASALVLPDGTEVALTGTRLVAGRLADNAIPIDDSTVSRAHAAFVKRGDGWWVLDLGSTNGTRVNGRNAAEHPIHPGDQVELGEVVVEVVER